MYKLFTQLHIYLFNFYIWQWDLTILSSDVWLNSPDYAFQAKDLEHRQFTFFRGLKIGREQEG